MVVCYVNAGILAGPGLIGAPIGIATTGIIGAPIAAPIATTKIIGGPILTSPIGLGLKAW